MKLSRRFVAAALLLISFSPLLGSSDPLADAQMSHVTANEPAPSDFARILKRDLEAFGLKELGAVVVAEVELLRKGATQSGMSYPKYYAWVTFSRDGKIVSQGAARLMAVARTHFEVTHFLEAGKIAEEPELLDGVFPAALIEGILNRVRPAA